ncbi:MAG: hypothetical protein RR786_05675, partial [Anaerorhabdus sp.]
EEPTTNEDDDHNHVHVGWDGIRVRDGDEVVDISWNGIHVKSGKDKKEFKAGKDGIYVNGDYKGNHWNWDSDDFSETVEEEIKSSFGFDDDDDYDYSFKKYPRTFLDYIPYGVIIFLAFLYLGVFQGMWHPAWILLFTIPIYTSFAKTVRKRNLYCFNYSMLAFTVFLYVGFYYGAWHPGWVVFVTIPVYYYLVHYFKRLFRKKKNEKDPNIIDVEVSTNEESSDKEQD